MPDHVPNFEALRDAHIAALHGSLIDGVEHGPGGAGYVWSRTIPDPTLNFAFGIRGTDQFAWAVAMARGHARDPAFLARDATEVTGLRRLFEPAAAYPASWMVARPGQSPPAEERSITMGMHPVPPGCFLGVFAELADDAAVKAHLERYYLPAFRAAQARPGVSPVHLVLSDASGPAACASLYLLDGLAGLYNVSTRADRQRRGLGAKLTAAAVRVAHARGAAAVFLQCPAGGAIEALYARTGFRTAHAPTLLCASKT